MKKKKTTRKKKPPYRDSRTPAREKVAKGHYIDFEGSANPNQKFPPPVLIGSFDGNLVLDFNGGFRQVVFTKDFRYAAEVAGVSHKVDYIPDRAGFIKSLVQQAGFSKPVFAFSEYEFNQLTHLVAMQIEWETLEKIDRVTTVTKEKKKQIKEDAEKMAKKKLERRYRNVKLIAERWCKKKIPKQLPDDWTLHDVAQSMELDVTAKLPRGGVTSRLRLVKEYSGSKRRWQAAPAKVRKAWREVLQHNLADVKLIVEMMNRMRPG